MALYICRNCSARNTEAGSCDMCGDSLGSLRIAMLAGFLSSLALGGLWVLTTWWLTVEVPIFAVVYGLVVSAAVAHFSAGRGIAYQAIATLWTAAGLIVADTLVVLMFWRQTFPLWGSDPLPSLWEAIQYQALFDPITFLFYSLGIVGGLWIWRG